MMYTVTDCGMEVPEGGRTIARPKHMMKQKILGLLMVILLLLGVCTGALAADDDPIVCSVEINPSKLVGPGTVEVTVTVSNSGDTDMTSPVVLYDPNAQIISDFGTDGEATLKAGQTITWQGEYEVNQLTLDNGYVMYFVKYELQKDDGSTVSTSQSIRGTVEMQTASVDIEVSRTISPTIAKEGQEISVTYLISNTGTINVENMTITEHTDIHATSQTIPLLEPGQTAEIIYPVTMGTEDLVSGLTVTYSGEGESEKLSYTVEDFTIVHGEPSLDVSLSAAAKGVVVNEKVMLTLVLENTGEMDLSDIRVSDATLGEVFSNQEVDAGESITLEKEITLTQTTDYLFTVTAIDSVGTEMIISSDTVNVIAVDPEDVLTLTLTLTSDRTEVFETPGVVRFSLLIENNSGVDAENVVITHGTQSIYEFTSIPAGESRTLTRDMALSMAGKYQFTATATDSIGSEVVFTSNEIQVAFSVATPAPVTPTPAPDPTPLPTFYAITMAPITDDSIGALPKLLQSILLPLLIIAGVVMFASIGLLIYATRKRRKDQKASEDAMDHLDRAKRRNYITENQVMPPVEPVAKTPTEENTDFDLPHQQFMHGVADSSDLATPANAVHTEEEPEPFSAMNNSFYDEEMKSQWSGYADDADSSASDHNPVDWSSYADTSSQETAYDGAIAPATDPYAPYDQAINPADPYAPYDGYDQAGNPADPYAPYDQYDQAGNPVDPYAPYDGYDQGQNPVDPYAPYDAGSDSYQYEEAQPAPYADDAQQDWDPDDLSNTARTRRMRSDR